MRKIKVAIWDYGDLGKGVEKALSDPVNHNMELVAIFTRRDQTKMSTASGTELVPYDIMEGYIEKVDVVILCGNSEDLLKQGPKIAAMFNTVDSFNILAKIGKYSRMMNLKAHIGEKSSIIAVDYDHGIPSIARGYVEQILPTGSNYMLWGKDINQEGVSKNQENTANILVAYARIAFYLSYKGEVGARTILDIPPRFLLPISLEETVWKNVDIRQHDNLSGVLI